MGNREGKSESRIRTDEGMGEIDIEWERV